MPVILPVIGAVLASVAKTIGIALLKYYIWQSVKHILKGCIMRILLVLGSALIAFIAALFLAWIFGVLAYQTRYNISDGLGDMIIFLVMFVLVEGMFGVFLYLWSSYNELRRRFGVLVEVLQTETDLLLEEQIERRMNPTRRTAPPEAVVSGTRHPYP